MAFAINDAAEISKLWRIRKTVFEMSHDRGYLVTKDELGQTLKQFKEVFGDSPSMQRPMRSDLNMLLTRDKDATDKMLVFFHDDPKIGIALLDIFVKRMDQEHVHRALIVSQVGLTSAAKRAVDCLKSSYIVEQFLESELVINVTQHEMVPQHVLLTEPEKQELFTRYKLQPEMLMRLLTTDPVARYYALKRGQVVKIIRNTDTIGRSVTYRMVH